MLTGQRDSSGLYLTSLVPGSGRRVRKGDTVEVHYEGHFLYGRIFDSTRRRNETVKFVYGNEWPLIEGLDIAVGKMSEGERAMVILPSDLAFGKTGSSTGIIPPYSTLVFEIEIVSLQ
jgi:FKBP-type peptidyl-prolyl cis-trans isomerase